MSVQQQNIPILESKINNRNIEEVPLQCGFTPDMLNIIPTPTPADKFEEDQTVIEEDVELIALITVAEAEGESEKGKRLVIDTILNRVDSNYFPDSISEVIYQKNQFTSVWNGRIDRCYVTDDVRQLVREEMITRSNYDVVFFTANQYGKYGIPMFREGNHYFSSYNRKE